VQPVVIAIDGFAGTGKSTLARDLADHLGYLYLDTGAMYRALTLYLLRHQVNWNNEADLMAALSKIDIDFYYPDGSIKANTRLNGEDVEIPIRSMEVAGKVSEVAAIPKVRKYLVESQRRIGSSGNIVMDGRDIGTVVFPNAACKLFITAPFSVRVERRFRELLSEGVEVTEEIVTENLLKRDREETERTDSPLKPAPDAWHLDTGNLNRAEQLGAALQLIRKTTDLI
jgi:CMP/dCMP kinase